MLKKSSEWSFSDFYKFTVLVVRDGTRFDSRRSLVGMTAFFLYTFSHLFRIDRVKNSSSFTLSTCFSLDIGGVYLPIYFSPRIRHQSLSWSILSSSHLGHFPCLYLLPCPLLAFPFSPVTFVWKSRTSPKVKSFF